MLACNLLCCTALKAFFPGPNAGRRFNLGLIHDKDKRPFDLTVIYVACATDGVGDDFSAKPRPMYSGHS